MRRVLVIAAILAIGAMLLGPLACRQIVGIQESPPTEPTTTACGLPYGTAACAACVSTNCCGESSACATTFACAQYEQCLGGCAGDPKCRARCTADNQLETTTEASALSACVAKHCETECGLTCGGLADYLTPPGAATACETCFSAESGSACSSALACASLAECDAHLRSFLSCVTDDCRQAVVSDSSAGGRAFAAFKTNWAGSGLSPATCASSCAVGNNWSCVGKVVWPPAPPSTTITDTGQVADAVDSFTSFVAGAQVSLCAGNCPCSTNPYAGPWTTDPSGTVDMTFRNSMLGGVTGCFQVTVPDSGVEPLFFYPGYPPTEPTSTLGKPFMIVGTPSEWTQSLGLPLDPTRALLGFKVVDCLGNAASGVQVTVSPSDARTQVFYGLPPQPGLMATETSANGGVTNVPVDVGSVIVTATPLALGKRMGFAQVAVQAGATTELVVLGPTPF